MRQMRIDCFPSDDGRFYHVKCLGQINVTESNKQFNVNKERINDSTSQPGFPSWSNWTSYNDEAVCCNIGLSLMINSDSVEKIYSFKNKNQNFKTMSKF